MSFLAALALIAILLSPALAGSWKGETVQVDGVTHFKNPASGMEKAKTITPKELWRLGGDTEDEDEFFGLITSILVDDDGLVYVLDSQLNEIKVYDENGGFLHSMGREGEGPGEFRNASGMFFLPDGTVGVLQAAPGKIVKLTKEGDPAGDQTLPTPEGAGFVIVRGGQSRGDFLNLVLGSNQFEEGKFTQTLSINRVSAEGEVLAKYVESPRTMEFANAVISESIWDGFENRWAMDGKGQVYTVDEWGKYAITVWGPDGKKQRVIEREMKHRDRDADEIALIEEIFSVFLRQIPNAKTDISGWDPDIHRMYAMDDGTLWVNHSYGASDVEDGTLGVFDVFDDKGRYQREVTIKGEGHPRTDAYYFVGDRLFVVTGLLEAAMAMQGGGVEIEEGEEPQPMSVICYKL